MRIPSLLIALLASLALQGQNNNNQAYQFDKERQQITQKGMLVLGGWSLANIITSTAAYSGVKEDARYFHQMNIIWNSVNVLFAGVGYLGARREHISDVSANAVMQRQQKAEKIFLFNAGLDVAYIVGGFYLKEKANSQPIPAKLKGFGNAVILQGSFLMLFDAAMYAVHHQHGKKLYQSKVQVTSTGNTIGVLIKLGK